MTRLTRRIAVAFTAALAAACSVTSTDYVDDQAGFSVTKGRILRIEDLHSEDVQPLADGVAIKLSRSGCRVALEFPDGRRNLLALPAGGILVCSHAYDYVLRMENGDAANATPKSGEQPEDSPPR